MKLKLGDLLTSKYGDKWIMAKSQIIDCGSDIPYVDESKSEKFLKEFNIVKVERPIKYKTIFEKKEILDETEKEYLKAVIKPFKNKIGTVCKVQTSSGDKEYLIIRLKNKDYMTFPTFEKGTMYKGMKTNVSYTLKELELDDED